MSVNQARMMAVLCVVLAIASAWRLGTLIFDFQFNYEMGVGLNDPSNLVEIVNDCPTDGVDCRCFGEPSNPLKVNGDVIIVDGNAGIGGDDPCNPTNKLTIEGFGKQSGLTSNAPSGKVNIGIDMSGCIPVSAYTNLVIDSSYYVLMLTPEPTTVVFGDVVTIDCTDGSVTFGEGVTADEAARYFWKTLSDVYPKAFPKKCKCHESTEHSANVSK